MADDIILFEGHHIIEQPLAESNDLPKKLREKNAFNIESPLNRLNLSTDKELAAKLNMSPHTGGPLGEYSKQIRLALGRIQNSPDFRAAQ